ncbi:hypothetical protein [Martelella mediterranea]|uniref:Uncharacterized protein n=1 Tax=Martelella mediterranea TaxID=293089 RepID=A0A4R3NW40_9HYPH|nr:hypothetical protein [Martelella mediterranea]TCT41144.1 hypothetical protein EDC90_1007121 [Martelella mediterranea]
MVRKYEKEYRLRENDDVLLRLKDVLRDIDLRVDAIELLGDAFTKGNRLDVDALVKSINDDFAQKSAQLADLLGELENGLTPDRIIETDEKRFTSDTEIAGLQDATAAVATALATGLAQKLNSATFTAHRDDKNNPHAVTKAQLGLSKVQNLTPAEMPVSEPQAAAIASRVAKSANLSDLDDVDAARENIGAQASLGYAPVNKAGDTINGWVTFKDGFGSDRNISVGGAAFATNGNADGSIWAQWGSTSAFAAIGNRIESRAAAYANARAPAGARIKHDSGTYEVGHVDVSSVNLTVDCSDEMALTGLRTNDFSNWVHVRAKYLRNY